MKKAMSICRAGLLFVCVLGGFAATCRADAPTTAPDTTASALAAPIIKGLRVFTCGHSFHAGVIPRPLQEIAESAGLKDHTLVGVSSIGASRAIQHFDVPDEKNKAKAALKAGDVDVLTLSCMERPDDGIAKFAELGFKYNPNIRVTLQELWIPEDHWPFDASHRLRKSVDEFNTTTMEELRKTNQPYFEVMENYVTELNKTLGKQVVFIVPDAQATLMLRERIIAGTAPGLKKQSDLFRDPWGHPTAPLRLLSAYTHFAVIYRRSPVGLPIPPSIAKLGMTNDSLNLLLQQLAWDAVIHHPMSGVMQMIDETSRK